jgi:hypothetical protein
MILDGHIDDLASFGLDDRIDIFERRFVRETPDALAPEVEETTRHRGIIKPHRPDMVFPGIPRFIFIL